MEKSLDEMSSAELRAALAEYAKDARPQPKPILVPGIITPDMTPEAQETSAKLYAEWILRKAPGTWTPQERDFMRRALADSLKEYGY